MKGRQVKDVIVDNSETKKVNCFKKFFISFIELRNNRSWFFLQIKLDLGVNDVEYGYDQSNAIVLPSKKRDTKVKKPEQKHVTRILSKKQRKNLEKIVEKKKKKEGVS